MKIEDLTILFVDQNEINYFGRKHDLTAFIAETTDGLNNLYGAGNWLVIPTADLPADFSVATYTISDGQLVRASAEVIAEREAAATLAYNEGQRQLREAEYRAATDPLVIDAIAESTPEIKALKDAIRAKYPYRS